MVSYPKISIITPSFNQGSFIEQTILSIINQNYPNLEYIIIDGGSTDNTVEIIKKYADQITYWVSEPDNGQSDAINKGIKLCTGELFNWINSDDYLEEDALFVIGEKYIETKADIICGYSRIFNDTTNVEIQKHRTEIFADVETTIVQQKINQQAMFYKLNVIKTLGGINSKLNFVMDLELWFRYLCKYGQSNMVMIDNLIAHFRIHNNSKTDNYQNQFREEENAIWNYLVIKLMVNYKWITNFTTNYSYILINEMEINSVKIRRLEIALSYKYFYSLYNNGNIILSRSAFFTLLKAGRISFSFQNLSMFVKLFIGDIPFRKFFKNYV